MIPVRAILPAVLLAGCATPNPTPVDACLSEAGRGWSYLYLPPPNSVELRKLTDVRGATPMLWFEKSADQLLACTHAQDKDCAAMIYQFRRENGLWQASWDHNAKACRSK